MSLTFSSKGGSWLYLKLLTRWGWSRCWRRIRCTVLRPIPSLAAKVRVLQWVLPAGGRRKVVLTTRVTSFRRR